MFMRKFIEFIFFGNFFYGLCVIAMSLDASLFQGFTIPYSYYLFIACFTVIYYTQSYERIFKFPKRISTVALTRNKCFQWLQRNNIAIFYIQIFLFVIGCVSLFRLIFFDIHNVFNHVRIAHMVIVLLLCLLAFFYYGTVFLPGLKFSLRIGLIKPFIIGLIWAGVVAVLPAVTEEIITDSAIFSNKTLYVFLDYFLLISILAIIFDIKDYEADNNVELKTFVVKMGKIRTINYIITPLCIVYILFCVYMFVLNFETEYIIYFLLPAIALLIISRKMFAEKNILFYLAAIDGLMLLKALTGIIIQIFLIR